MANLFSFVQHIYYIFIFVCLACTAFEATEEREDRPNPMEDSPFEIIDDERTDTIYDINDNTKERNDPGNCWWIHIGCGRKQIEIDALIYL